MAITEFKRVRDLEKYNAIAMKRAMQYANDFAMSKLLEYIMNDTYRDRDDNKFYDRTYDFLEGWRVKIEKDNDNNMVTRFYFDEKALSHDSENFIHGSEYSKYGELSPAEFLAIMNGDGNSKNASVANFPTWEELGRKPFWEDFIKWANKDGGYAKVLKNAYKNAIQGKLL